MRHGWWLGAVLGVGCYSPPDFPLLDEIPIVAPAETCAPPREGYVACVLDGDTFDLGACGDDVGERIRMLGIDAPEIAHDPDPADCFGEIAQFRLMELLDGAKVTLTFDAECEGAFGRTLAYVWLEGDDLEDLLDQEPVAYEYLDSIGAGEGSEALLLNEYLLAGGYARLYPEEIAGPLQRQRQLEFAEADAQVRGLGLWGACEGATGTARAAEPGTLGPDEPGREVLVEHGATTR